MAGCVRAAVEAVGVEREHRAACKTRHGLESLAAFVRGGRVALSRPRLRVWGGVGERLAGSLVLTPWFGRGGPRWGQGKDEIHGSEGHGRTSYRGQQTLTGHF